MVVKRTITPRDQTRERAKQKPNQLKTSGRLRIGAGRSRASGVDVVLHPEREPFSVLHEIKRAMGSLEFSAQYQQRPIPVGGNLVQWAWFKTHEHAPAPLPRDRIVVSWDTAMSASELSDYSACVVLLVRDSAAFVLDVARAARLPRAQT